MTSHRLRWLLLPLLSSFGCTGGQTFDDGSDELRTLSPRSDAGSARVDETREGLGEDGSGPSGSLNTQCESFEVVGEAPSADTCGCTRRPGEGNSALSCPVGVAAEISAVIGPEGGTLQLSGTRSTLTALELTIDPGALSEEVTVTITETTVPPPAAILDASPMFHLAPADLVLNSPAILRVPWSVESGLVPPLSTFVSNDGSCSLAPLEDDYQNAGFNNASTTRFGWLVVGAARGENTAECP